MDLSQSLMQLFKKTLIKQNSDELCSISVKQLGKRYSVTLFIKIGVFRSVRDKLMNDAWNMIHDVTGRSSEIYQKDCEKKDNIREEISKESKFEKLLNDHLSNIKKTCESEIGGTIVEIDLDACDQAEQIEKIKVVESYSNKGSIILVLDFYVNTITDSMSIDELLWELQIIIQDILGKGRVKLVHNETINTHQNRQW